MGKHFNHKHFSKKRRRNAKAFETAEIIEFQHSKFEAERAWVRLGNELTVSIGKLRGPRLRAQPVTTFTARDGRLLRSVIRVDHQVQWGTGRSARLEITGDGPMARSARELGLDRARIVAAFRTDRFRAQLPAGADVGKS